MYCPHCEHPDIIRQGTKARSMKDIQNGDIVEREIRVQRWKCLRCFRFFTELPEGQHPKSTITPVMRQQIVEHCMDMGYLATAEKFQLDEKTIKSIWNTWSSQQQDNIALPEHIGLHHIWIAGGDRILITDVQRNTLIEILPITSQEAVLAWIRARNYQDINTAMIGFDVDLRDLIKMINPLIEIRISRPHTKSYIDKVFLNSLRILRRNLGVSRNVKETARLFATHKANLTISEKDIMMAWDDDILKLWLAKEDLHDALDKNASQCQEIFENTTKRCKDISARLPVVMFIITWREFILNGLKSNDEAGISIQHLTTLTKDKRPILTWDLEKRSLLNHPHYLEYPSPFKNPFHIKTTPSPIPTYLDRGVELTYIVTKLQTKKASR